MLTLRLSRCYRLSRSLILTLLLRLKLCLDTLRLFRRNSFCHQLLADLLL